MVEIGNAPGREGRKRMKEDRGKFCRGPRFSVLGSLGRDRTADGPLANLQVIVKKLLAIEFFLTQGSTS